MESTGCLLRIKEMLPCMTPQEKALGQYMLEQPENASGLGIEELAEACGVSSSTVVRLCRKLGYTGYKDFSRALFADQVMEPVPDEFEDIHPGDDLETVLRNMVRGHISAIENTAAINAVETLNQALDLLVEAQRIDFYGFGTSGFVAQDAANKFLRVKKTVSAHIDFHTQILTAMTLAPGDVAVLISYSGETAEMLRLCEMIRAMGIKVISITKYSRNTLAEMADVNLYVCSTETMLRSGAMSSRIAQMTVIDVLYAALCTRCFNEVKGHLEKTREAVAMLRKT